MLAHQLRGVRLLALLDQIECQALFRIELSEKSWLMRVHRFRREGKALKRQHPSRQELSVRPRQPGLRWRQRDRNWSVGA